MAEQLQKFEPSLRVPGIGMEQFPNSSQFTAYGFQFRAARPIRLTFKIQHLTFQRFPLPKNFVCPARLVFVN